MNRTTDEIKRKMRARLALKGSNQRQLAQQLGIHETALSRIVTGGRSVTMDRWEEILQPLGLSLKVEVVDSTGQPLPS